MAWDLPSTTAVGSQLHPRYPVRARLRGVSDPKSLTIGWWSSVLGPPGRKGWVRVALPRGCPHPPRWSHAEGPLESLVLRAALLSKP